MPTDHAQYKYFSIGFTATARLSSICSRGARIGKIMGKSLPNLLSAVVSSYDTESGNQCRDLRPPQRARFAVVPAKHDVPVTGCLLYINAFM